MGVVMVGGAVEIVEDRTLMRMVLWLCFDGDGTHCARHPSASSRPFEFWWGVKHCSSRPLTGQAVKIWGRRPDRRCVSAVPALSGRTRGLAVKKVPETSPCWLCPLLHAPGSRLEIAAISKVTVARAHEGEINLRFSRLWSSS